MISSAPRLSPAFRGLSLLLGAAIGLACGAESERTRVEPRLVLLYATCSLSRVHLSPYDPTVPYTPSIQRFADQGVVLERHHTESGQSGVAFASIFTGLQAADHGVLQHPETLRPELDLIGEHFERAGYETHSWLDQKLADASLGYAQGVSESRQHQGLLRWSSPSFIGLLGRLQSDPALKAFVVTNFTATHSPYQGAGLDEFCQRHPKRCGALSSPNFLRHRGLYIRRHLDLEWEFEKTVRSLGMSPKEQRQLEATVALLYEADVSNLDRLFGRVIQAVERAGLLEQSVVVFTSDHGEIHIRDNAAFRWTHGMQLAPEVLHVPMIIRAPSSGLRPGRYAGVTRSVDVLATVLGLSGIPAPVGTRGVDLSAALRREVPAPSLTAWSHTAILPSEWRKHRLHRYPRLAARFPTTDPGELWAAARRGNEFFELRRDEVSNEHIPHLYLLDRDPGKRHNVFSASDPQHTNMREQLSVYLRELEESYHTDDSVNSREASEKEAEARLRSLGYIE